MRAFGVLGLIALLAGPALAQAPAASGPTTSAPPRAPAASPAAPTVGQGALIDINAASKDELKTLAGIGEARAEAIIKGRPYRGKDELARRNIIPDSVYASIKDRIIAHQAR